MITETEFKQIYIRFFRKLVYFADRYVLSEEDAEDIVQDVFLHLWKNRYPMETVVYIQSFLFELTKRKCIDFLRHKVMSAEKENTLQDTLMQEYKYNMYALEAFDERLMEQEELFGKLEDAIQSLPPQCREVFLLCKREGWTHKRIAAEMNISTATVNNHIVQALKKLKNRLINQTCNNI